MTLDLSEVTDTLIGLVKNQWTTAPIWATLGVPTPTFTPNFTGLAPDAARNESGPQLSMYLYHVESDNASESLSWKPQMLDAPGGSPTRLLPLALNLFYLLFAYSQTSYTEEHEAMSVALRIYHDNPIVRGPSWELTLTMEHRSYDELSRLWQATTVPLRMSLVFRAAVVFIDPDPMPPDAIEVGSVSVDVVPASLPLPVSGAGDYPVVLGTIRTVSYKGPDGAKVTVSQAPATVAAGQTAVLTGTDLGVGGVSDGVYLLSPVGGAEVDVTAWMVSAGSSVSRLVLTLPAAGSTTAADIPDPGVYQLRAGSGASGSPGATRTGSTPISVAAYVDPSSGPLLAGQPPFTVSGLGFTAGRTEVFVGTVAMTEVLSASQAGEVSIDASGTSFSLWPPGEPAGTVLAVRVRVNGIESDPALWVTL
ncbi:MAG: DUF4255 domain-containing protein [Solirubrobacteraceae bacterium]